LLRERLFNKPNFLLDNDVGVISVFSIFRLRFHFENSSLVNLPFFFCNSMASDFWAILYRCLTKLWATMAPRMNNVCSDLFSEYLTGIKNPYLSFSLFAPTKVMWVLFSITIPFDFSIFIWCDKVGTETPISFDSFLNEWL